MPHRSAFFLPPLISGGFAHGTMHPVGFYGISLALCHPEQGGREFPSFSPGAGQPRCRSSSGGTHSPALSAPPSPAVPSRGVEFISAKSANQSVSFSPLFLVQGRVCGRSGADGYLRLGAGSPCAVPAAGPAGQPRQCRPPRDQRCCVCRQDPSSAAAGSPGRAGHLIRVRGSTPRPAGGDRRTLRFTTLSSAIISGLGALAGAPQTCVSTPKSLFFGRASAFCRQRMRLFTAA